MSQNELWSEQLSVGVAEIDEEHRELRFLIQRLQWAMKQGDPTHEIRLILDTLADHALTHFSTEESHFLETGYPQAHSHALEHRRFERKINQFIRSFEAGQPEVASEMLSHLIDWLAKHIEGTDKEFAAFLTENQHL